ncbi:hypothetical protein BJY00DRAFT_153836 [Aspergillus carlsbadensis]|nr:hypothetical protein BJY00DRAFT_153836 [Aspergillus carlsbadensis]
MPSHSDYRIGWICALSLELAAAEAMLDQVHEPLPNRRDDQNTYVLGNIRNHNIVIACLPAGVYGTTSATAAAIYMRTSFPSLRFCLMVGIAGGAPNPRADIRLGDVIVSKPTPGNGGVIQYDYGKSLVGEFIVTGSLDKPPAVLLTAIARLEASHHLYGTKIPQTSAELVQLFGERTERFSSPGPDNDLLFASQYGHVECDQDRCDACDRSMLQPRTPRRSTEPCIFYGLVASANQVLRNTAQRDSLSRRHGILCFEMEAAGLMDVLPCLVIRGISDYCDSHKSNQWQGYAAINAAAYAKELLSVIPFPEVARTPTVDRSTSYVRSSTHLVRPERLQQLPLLPSSSNPVNGLDDFLWDRWPDALLTLDPAGNARSNHPLRPKIFPQVDDDDLPNHLLAVTPQSPHLGAAAPMGVSMNPDTMFPSSYSEYSAHHSQPTIEPRPSKPTTQPTMLSPTYTTFHDNHISFSRTSSEGSTEPVSSGSTGMTTSRLLVGIDIGTRYTRVAYTSSNHGKPLLFRIAYWPNHEGATDKVPTEASQDASHTYWGYGSTLPDASLPLHWLWAILVNDAGFESDLASHVTFTADAVKETRSLGPQGEAGHALAQFLQPLWAYTLSAIGAHLGERFVTSATIQAVFTLPTVWAEIGRRAFSQAVKLAGILEQPGTQLRVMTRTTGAAQAVLYEAPSSLRYGQAYIVCHAGSTTIDVATYSDTWRDNIKFKEVTGGAWEMVGGDDVDSAFEDALQHAAGALDYTLDETLLRDILAKEWKGHIKPNFRGVGHGPEYHTISVASDPSQPEELWIPAKVIAETFDEPLAVMRALIDDQRRKVKHAGQKLEGIVLVGGLACSPYVYESLKAMYSPQVVVVNGESSRLLG